MPPLDDRRLPRLDARRSKLRLLGEWLSAHYPFVWRTRALFFVAVGMLLAAASAAYALRMDVRRETLERIPSSLVLLSTWSFAGYGAALLISIDVIRRVRPIVGVPAGVRIFACIAASIFALMLPEYAYINGYVPRVAALESDASLANIMDAYGPYNFWQCQNNASDFARAIEPHRDQITADLERYGLKTDFSSSYDYAGCSNLFSSRESLTEWSTESPDPEVQYRGLFKARVMHIEAAKQYARHDGAYEGVAMGHMWAIVWTSVTGGMFTALLSSPVVWRLWTTMKGHRKRVRVSSRRRALVDERRAARRPALWSSRLPASTLQLLAAPALILFYAVVNPTEYWIAWIAVPVVVAAVFLACRTQEGARYLSAYGRLDVGVLLIHAAAFLAVMVPLWFVASATKAPEELTLTVFGVIIWCGFLQGARNGSALTAFGALVLIGAVGFALIMLYQLTGVAPSEKRLPIHLFVITALFTIMLRYADRIEVRRSVRGLLIAAILTFSSVPFLLAATAVLIPQSADITLASVTVSVLVALGGTSLFLLLTERARRRLSYSTR